LFNTKEAFEYLKNFGLASNLNVFRRWINQGKINIIKPDNPDNRKEGYKIDEKELLRYIGETAPGTLELIERNVFLEKENKELKQKLENKS